MNTEQQAAAKGLYFQTSLSVTQISEVLQVPRSTLHYWIRKNNWDRIRQSAAVMPTLIAENCHLMIARLSENVLSEDRMTKPCTSLEANTMYKLALTAGKMKTRATIGENLEMLGFFMDFVNKQSPEMATAILPFVENYVASRAAININQLTPDHFNELGLIPRTEKDNTETKLDLQDIMEWSLKDTTTADIEQFRSMKDPEPAIANAAPAEAPAVSTPVIAATPVAQDSVTSAPGVISQTPANVEPAPAAAASNTRRPLTDLELEDKELKLRLEKYRDNNGQLDLEKYLEDTLAIFHAPPKLDTVKKFLKYQEKHGISPDDQTNKAA